MRKPKFQIDREMTRAVSSTGRCNRFKKARIMEMRKRIYENI